MWFDGPMSRLTVRGNVIADQVADALNFHTGVTDSVVRDNFVRNTGDDGLAMWAEHQQDARNTFDHNTVQSPVLANGIALYGGTDNTVSRNLVADPVREGSGIQLGSRFGAEPFTGHVRVRDNTTVRAGTYELNWEIGLGAIWFYALERDLAADVQVVGNHFLDNTYNAIMFVSDFPVKDRYSITGVRFRDNLVDGTGTSVRSARSSGGASFENTDARNVGAVGVNNCGSFNFPPTGSEFTVADLGGNDGGWYRHHRLRGGDVLVRGDSDLLAAGTDRADAVPAARAGRDAAGGGGQPPAARPGGRLDDAGVLRVPVLPAGGVHADRDPAAGEPDGVLRGADLRQHAAAAALLLLGRAADAGPGVRDVAEPGDVEHRAERGAAGSAGLLRPLPGARPLPGRDGAGFHHIVVLRADPADRRVVHLPVRLPAVQRGRPDPEHGRRGTGLARGRPADQAAAGPERRTRPQPLREAGDHEPPGAGAADRRDRLRRHHAAGGGPDQAVRRRHRTARPGRGRVGDRLLPAGADPDGIDHRQTSDAPEARTHRRPPGRPVRAPRPQRGAAVPTVAGVAGPGGGPLGRFRRAATAADP